MTEFRKPIKVLHYIGKLGSGGIEKLLVSLLENIDRKEVAFDFLLWNNSKKGFYDDYVQSIGANLLYLNLDEYENNAQRALAKIIKLYSFLKKSDYSILHLHGTSPMDYFNAYLAKKAGIKTVIVHAHSTRGSTRLRTKVLPAFKTLFWKYPSYYLACSQEAADYMWPKGLDKDKGCILINGIDVSKYVFSEEKRRAFRRENNIEGKYVVGHIGRFAEQKNHSFLINIFYQIQNRIPESVLLLIGEGQLEADIRNQVEELGIGDKVIFFGTTGDVPSALMGMDVMCFPSLSEGLGMVAIEAQAAGLKVLCSDGVPQEAKITDLLEYMPLSDGAERWAEKILTYNDGYERKNMEQEIKDAGYDIKASAKELENIYLGCRKENTAEIHRGGVIPSYSIILAADAGWAQCA